MPDTLAGKGADATPAADRPAADRPAADRPVAETPITNAPVANAPVANAPVANAMTVDVEDYFQVWALSSKIARASWERQACRIEANMDLILDLFRRHGAKATFFTLGWVAERYPGLVRRIVDDGHELASHGLEHVRVSEQSPAVFRQDVRRAKAILEDCGGVAVKGYRAASFSIDERSPWAFEILAEEGYGYSSSLHPIRHDHYGMPGAPRFAFRPDPDKAFREVPVTTLRLFGQNWPCGGGGYFRLFPYALSRWALKRVNAKEGASCVFYFHPWEVDPGQPRIAGLSAKTRFRHYVNLARMAGRLEALLKDFAWQRMDRLFLEDEAAAGRGRAP